LLLFFSLLLGSKQYFGDPIECIVDPKDHSKFTDILCWVRGTFTVKEYVYDSVGHIVGLSQP